MKKCPQCELNYIKDEEEFCQVCRPSVVPKIKKHYKSVNNNNKTEEEREKDVLNAIGASWAICYLYYKHIDHSFTNYKLVSTYPSRQTLCDNNESYVVTWLIDCFHKNEKLLSTNSLGVSGDEVKTMAIKLAEYYLEKLKGNK